jgi:hypothetical protein
MFDLEKSISDWRRQMQSAGIKSPVPLDELEIHLREDVERQTKSGRSEADAFDSAVGEMGEARALKCEFKKAGGTLHERAIQALLTLAGIPNRQLAMNMNMPNSNLNLEPRWATYLKASAFLMPAACLWLFSAIFLLPKLNEICNAAGSRAFNFPQAPAIFRTSATIAQVMVFLTAHWIQVGGMVVLALVLLEWRFNGWSRYRRASLGAGIFLFNFAVLLSITLMVLSALLGANALLHHVK